MAAELLMSISKDEHERAKFRSRRKFETDLASNLATAEDRGVQRGVQIGIEEGREEGIQIGVEEEKKKAFEEKLETAASLLDVLDANTIAEKFKITVEEVERLKKSDKFE